MMIEIHAVYLAVIIAACYVTGIITAMLRRRKGHREMDFMLRALGAYIVERCFDGDEEAAQAEIQKWIDEIQQRDMGGIR